MGFQEYTSAPPDATGRMISRTLLQFRESPVFLDLVRVFASEVQALLDAARGLVELRQPALAAGESLEALGRIVGQARGLVDFDAYAWFTPDEAYRGADQGPAWVEGAPLAGTLVMDDAQYRETLQGRVLRNHAQYGSVPEIQAAILQSFGVRSSITRTTDLMTVLVTLEASAGNNVVSFLERVGDTETADQVYFLPVPATTRIAQVVRAT